MTSFKRAFTPLFFVCLFATMFYSMKPVEAGNYTALNLTDIAVRVGVALTTTTFAGQLICSAILMMCTVLPITIIARSKKAGFIPEIATVFVSMGVCIAIGWLEPWFLLIVSLLVALMYAGKARNAITGSG